MWLTIIKKKVSTFFRKDIDHFRVIIYNIITIYTASMCA